MPVHEQSDADIITAATGDKLGPVDAPPKKEKATQAEAANATLSPSTEADALQKEAVKMFDVAFGDNTRQLSETQIAGTFDRYAALNQEHMAQKPVLDMVKAVIASAQSKGQNVSPGQVAQFLTAAAQAYVKNPTMGGQQAPASQAQAPGDIAIPSQGAARAGVDPSQYDQDLTQWEEDNGVTLPPGFRQQAQDMHSLQGQNQQLAGYLKQVLQGQQGTKQAAEQTLVAADVKHVDALKQAAATNLDRAQQEAGLPNDMQDAFFQFANERGYSFEDFIDPALAQSVINDFKAVSDGPELARLKNLATKRQAFTGVEGSPGGGSEVLKTDEDTAYLNNLVDSTIEKKAANNTL